jgi:hypothetical protein
MNQLRYMAFSVEANLSSSPRFKEEMNMKTTMLIAAFVALAFPAYGREFSPPTISKQQEEAYNQTYKTDMAQEQQLKSGGKTRG